MKGPTEIYGTDLFFTRTEYEIKVIADDLESDIAQLPANWNDEQVTAWAQGYRAGNARGHLDGLREGVQSVQRSMLEALGLRAALRAIEDDMRTLGGVLYWHDGISREDVARIAGRE